MKPKPSLTLIDCRQSTSRIAEGIAKFIATSTGREQTPEDVQRIQQKLDAKLALRKSR